MPAQTLFPNNSAAAASSKKKAAASWYAIYLPRQGHQQLVRSWEACRALVHGVTDARYKKLKTRAEAETYLANLTRTTDLPVGQSAYTTPHQRQPLPQPLKLDVTHRWSIYTDGSKIKDWDELGWGWLLLQDDKILIGEELGFLPANAAANVAAELHAVLQALKTLTPALQAKNATSRLTIHYDYLGIEHWALGTWKAKTALTQQYQATMAPFKSKLQFSKVNAHGANPWNDRIDKLVRSMLKRRAQKYRH